MYTVALQVHVDILVVAAGLCYLCFSRNDIVNGCLEANTIALRID